VAQDGAFRDSADLLTTPSDMILNAGVPYAVDLPGPYAKRVILYLAARNLLDRTYAASAQNPANSVDPRTCLQNAAAVLAATPGSVLAGAPRNIVSGMKLAF
jgi:iron complex outermembrane receptor protein